jgi:hypothetical protein
VASQEKKFVSFLDYCPGGNDPDTRPFPIGLGVLEERVLQGDSPQCPIYKHKTTFPPQNWRFCVMLEEAK